MGSIKIFSTSMDIVWTNYVMEDGRDNKGRECLPTKTAEVLDYFNIFVMFASGSNGEESIITLSEFDELYYELG